ncbi:hypothetical protein C0W88_13980 [Photobacterium leiognathi subsp. mandapamensis]|uniref:hypothetical protein n=1 Tax=Photobacterium leiognathi TaxID=553611 RepID=UPI000D151916|nr:hypothetical protein [Photobacterium leiognathi]PSW64814.1 hypothetical protein C0W88_13980 [Photobacterium leiognathi subsp. mandapamensis]
MISHHYVGNSDVHRCDVLFDDHNFHGDVRIDYDVNDGVCIPDDGVTLDVDSQNDESTYSYHRLTVVLTLHVALAVR